MHAIHTRIQYIHNLIHIYSVSLPSHNNSMQCCGFQQWGSDKTQAQQHPFPAQTLQHSPNSLSLGLWVLWWRDWDGLRQSFKRPCQTHKGSGLFHSHSASQALNHFPLHYKKTFVFPHLHPPPLKTVAGFNHLNERMYASIEVSTVMSPVQHSHHTYTVRPVMYIPPLVFPKYSHAEDTQSQRERGSGSHVHLFTLTLSASCWWIYQSAALALLTSRTDNTVLTVASLSASVLMFSSATL